MPEENPYRYEGSAESLATPREQEREVRQTSRRTLFLWSLLGAFLVDVYLPLFVDLYLLPVTFFFLVIVTYPIGEFVFEYARKKNRKRAYFRFWNAAAKVTIAYSILMLFLDWSLGFELEITFPLFLIGFCPQLCAALVPLIFLTRAR